MGLVLKKQDAEKFIRLNQELIFKELFNNKLKYKIPAGIKSSILHIASKYVINCNWSPP